MSIRVTLCFLFVLGFSIYAWRNWFVSLCATILLMAVIEHPDMPKSIGGMQGLNLWNLLLVNVLLSWASQRRTQGLVWDMPRLINWLLLGYLTVVSFASLRLLWTRGSYGDEYTTVYIISEHFINCFKWVLPGLLLYDSCRTRRRVEVAMIVIGLLYVLLAIQVIKWVPLSYAMASGDDLSKRASKIIQNEIGYNRVTLSNILGGASWGILGLYVLFRKRRHQLGVLALAGVVAMAQALTGGRTGYASWAVVGFILCMVRWRWMLPIMAASAVALLTLLPGVRERLLQGVGGQQGNIIVQNEIYEMTSGRTVAWPYVLKKIGEGPIFGFGREGMVTTGIRDDLMQKYGESFPHPHQAYLQLLLDSGLVGFLPVMAFYGISLLCGLRLLLDRQEPLCAAAGGLACALVLALLVGSLGGQTFYPREGSLGMWAAIFLMLRVRVERQNSMATGRPLFAQEEDQFELPDPEESPQAA